MSTKEKKRCDEPFVPSSRRRKVRKSSLERDRRCARKRKRGGVGEKSAPKRPGHNVLLLPAVSLWNDRIQNALSLLRRRPHESTRLVAATSSSPLGQFYRYIIELHSSPDGFPSVVERSTQHTQRESGFKNAIPKQSRSLAFVCWSSYLPHPPSPRDRGRRE